MSSRPETLAISAVLVWLSLDFLMVGKAIYISTGDNGDVILSGLLANGSSDYGRSLWNPFTTAGNDRLAQGFYGLIDDYLFMYLPGWFAYQLRIFSQIAAAVIGTYALARRLELAPLASVVAGFVYAEVTMSGQLVQSVISYLPLSILTLSTVLDRPWSVSRWCGLAAVTIVIALTAYLSRLQPFVLFVHLLWFGVIERRRRLPDWAIIGAFSVILSLMRYQDYMAAVLHGQISHRVAQQLFGDGALLNLFERTFSVQSNLFYLIAKVLFAAGLVMAFVRPSKIRSPFAAFLLGAGLVVVATAIQPQAARILPLVGSFDLVRLVDFLWIFLALGVATLANRDVATIPVWLPRWISGRASAPVILLGLLALASIDIKSRAAKDWISQGSYVLAFGSKELRSLAARANEGSVPARVAAFQMYPTMLHPYGIETIGGYQALHIRRFYEWWQLVIARSKDTIRGDRLMLSPESHRPQWDFGAEYNEDLLSLANVRYVVSRDRLTSPNLVPVRETDIPWSSLGTRDKIAHNLADNFVGRRNLFVYENPRALPRFFFVPRLIALEGEEKVLAALEAASLQDLRTAVVVQERERPAFLDTGRTYGSGSIDVVHYSSDEIRVRAETDDDAILVATNGYSPFWTAQVNGTAQPIFPAYHAFWAIGVPKGASEIKFRYAPPWR